MYVQYLFCCITGITTAKYTCMVVRVGLNILQIGGNWLKSP